VIIVGRCQGVAVGQSAMLPVCRIALVIVASVFLGLGTMSLIAPSILTPLVEIVLPTPVAMMEVRGVYGGFFAGIGLFFLLSARRDAWIRPGLVAQASVFGGFVFGRTLGIVIGGAPNGFIGPPACRRDRRFRRRHGLAT
jgi:hypothetical protein